MFDLLVTRVVNTYGPQTHGGGGHGAAGEQQRGLITRDCGNAAIEERLQNIETHLRLPEGQRIKTELHFIQVSRYKVCICTDLLLNRFQTISFKICLKQMFPSLAGPVPLNVYQRLKKLEDRILELEGLSPEYFQSTVSFVAIHKIHMLNISRNINTIYYYLLYQGVCGFMYFQTQAPSHAQMSNLM